MYVPYHICLFILPKIGIYRLCILWDNLYSSFLALHWPPIVNSTDILLWFCYVILATDYLLYTMIRQKVHCSDFWIYFQGKLIILLDSKLLQTLKIYDTYQQYCQADWNKLTQSNIHFVTFRYFKWVWIYIQLYTKACSRYIVLLL